jgi:hypothetical protein
MFEKELKFRKNNFEFPKPFTTIREYVGDMVMSIDNIKQYFNYDIHHLFTQNTGITGLIIRPDRVAKDKLVLMVENYWCAIVSENGIFSELNLDVMVQLSNLENLGVPTLSIFTYDDRIYLVSQEIYGSYVEFLDFIKNYDGIIFVYAMNKLDNRIHVRQRLIPTSNV